jgi:hypothetical protein
VVECIFLAALSFCNIPNRKCLERIPRNVSGPVTCLCDGEDVLCGRYENVGVPSGVDGRGKNSLRRQADF